MQYSFGEIMQGWLYGQNGYYHKAHIGKDFYTAVNVSRLFGGALARHIITLLESSQLTLPLHIIEIGAHHGELMCDVYDFLGVLSVGVMEQTRFSIIEPLESLRFAAKENLATRAIAQVGDFDAVELGGGESVFIFSNELFDAFACEVVREAQGRTQMLCGVGEWQKVDSSEVDSKGLDSEGEVDSSAVGKVDSRGSLRLEWCDMAALRHSGLAQRVQEVKRFMREYGLRTGEIPLAWEGFVRDLCSFAKRAKLWRFLSFDYAPLGSGGLSLRGFRAHRVLDFTEIMRDVSLLFGEIDLTYNVDFTLLERLFASNGAHKLFQSRLNALLVEFGIIELLQSLLEAYPSEYESQTLRVRQLLGGGLGEKFMGVCFSG